MKLSTIAFEDGIKNTITQVCFMAGAITNETSSRTNFMRMTHEK